ncbi:phosphopantothenoylcysteine decarboxylase / phosphopantothenate--cysteine ligase [Paenibacillus sophorae]|uniref:Coenzyme A biosynthesis bifunctional protein CoaBC n=1 Tax=Paenibacillus sophorae TaxID=1333845 RepID=A0A1H8JUS6_9BACL|nr:bifunctional phosphopantothenoylcysteine decarboxylase/phosphopantothenate--cysteine ligase CoaBC [Paenibacillus sophorae]QWU13491.1 bifunctional phosphopantothenoylcysteine decarboxylase/phosphopantothenate--cysteine ligase CoaBC [Paenibacillus sophorae]SEN84351.1 phosphopantothenoylcysteine decarboxylase / phosphopantothenate--cysteine ligase [Paenibacillus sophorae]
MLKGKTILLGITGGIAAYKAAALCSKLVQKGAKVHVIMTASAKQFITELTLQSLSKQRVYSDTFQERDPSSISHIDLADSADLVLVAPATANIIAKMAHGIADDMLSTVLLAATGPVMVAPAMNVHMYQHPAVQNNLDILAKRGIQFIEPGEGLLACGYVGKGRMEEPETIVSCVETYFEQKAGSRKLAGKKVVITAGGTVERIDPVRYISNDSSGKMGFALARAAKEMGAEVTLVAARTDERPPLDVNVVRVQSADEMYDAVSAVWEDCDILIKAAAVSDYRPKERADTKIKKSGDTMTLELVKTVDILETLGERKQHQLLIGFAAETGNAEMYAKDKLVRKNLDLIVANDVGMPGAGFSVDTNIVSIYDKRGLVEELPLLSKDEVARRLLAIAATRLPEAGL